MASLISLIPDVEVLVELSPQELAFVLLQLVNENKQNGLLHP